MRLSNSDFETAEGGSQMKLVRTKEEIQERTMRMLPFILSKTRMTMATFTTEEEVVRQVIPPPLEPGPTLTASAYVAEFRKPNFGPPYNEAAVFLPVQYKGESGNYCLSMPVDNTNMMLGGRELYGYPKKMAESISVERTGNTAKGICVRRGIPIIEIEAELSDISEDQSPMEPHFLVKSIVGVGMKPLLMKQHNRLDIDKLEIGKGTLKFAESENDPLHEIPIVDVKQVSFTESATVTMPPTQVIVAELDPNEYAPYQYIKYDWDP
jgi:acetoacetate decarboxylase